MSDLIGKLLSGDQRALARLISQVEDRGSSYREILDGAFLHTGEGYRIGVTGPPGAGKSTIVDRLVPILRTGSERVGILACDPSSPFTRGALLGDRIRMREIAQAAGVFIRSMATRGALGGLGRGAQEAAVLLEAAGFPLVILETIGVGQAEVDIVESADSVVLVLTPQSGDAIQAMKAGLMEIADVFVVNKSDQGGADLALQNLESILSLSPREWSPPLIKASANRGEGIEDLKKGLDRHREFLKGERLQERRRARLKVLLKKIMEEELELRLWSAEGGEVLNGKVEELLKRRASPYQVARELLKEIER